MFPESQLTEESRGQWYVRQLCGSANIEGPRWFHILSGHLSFQIEHHLFPDIPAHRYPQLAVKVRELCNKYGLPYETGSFGRQLASTARRILRHAVPSRAQSQPHASDEATQVRLRTRFEPSNAVCCANGTD